VTEEIYWVREIEPLRLALMPRPQAGNWLPNEVAAWNRAGLETVVCLLEFRELHKLGLIDEQALCEAHGIEFLSLPIPDRGVPFSWRETVVLVDVLVSRLQTGTGVGVHCRGGIGRSGLISACVLLKLGVPFPEAFPMLSRARGVLVPETSAQIAWLKAFARKSAIAL
jgi:protein-tyrosine phosphatase